MVIFNRHSLLKQDNERKTVSLCDLTVSFSCELRSSNTCRYWNCLEGRFKMSSFRVVIPRYTRVWKRRAQEHMKACTHQTGAKTQTRIFGLLHKRVTEFVTSSSQYRRITSSADSVMRGASSTSLVNSLEEGGKKCLGRVGLNDLGK